MWNNLKSDIYRVLHTKSFYIILIAVLVVFAMILTDNGIQSNTFYAQFYRDENTFNDFLYFMPKCGLFVFIILLFISIFTSDEYAFNFAKNTYSICTQKWKLIVEKYLVNFLIISFYFLMCAIMSFIIQAINPMKQGTIQLDNYIIYAFVQILMISTVASFIMMITHIVRSRVLAILISIVYSTGMWYSLIYVLMDSLFKKEDLSRFTLYELAGALPSKFSWDGYSMAFLFIIGTTLLYNGISIYVLKKRDI